MKRASYISWEQLRVGILIVVALSIMGLAVYKLGKAANLFASRYELVTFLPNAAGLREGGQVMIAGQLAGSIAKVEFLPVDYDTTRNLRVTMQLDASLREQVRSDSKIKVRTLGLLGDKVLDINPGTPKYSVLSDGDTIRADKSLDYEAILAQAGGAVDDMVALVGDLRGITGGIVRGEGTVGQLVTNRSMYNALVGTLQRTNAMLARVQGSNGTLGRLIDDPTLYNRLVAVLHSTDSLVVALNNSNGTMGKLLRDDQLYTNMVGITASADSMIGQIAHGNGLANRLLTDQQLYDQLNKLVNDLSAVLADVRKDPRPYTKGLVNVCLFGCGKK
ncbi:MAG: MlaD family protein [Gemmatimonadaceae bacterium]